MSEPTLPSEDVAFDETAVEALLTGSSGFSDPVTAVLDAWRAEGRRFVPEPSPALAELFVTGLARDDFTRRRNRSRIVVGMLLAGGTTLGLSGVAAAHDALPRPAQSVVTDIVNGFTPFHIDRGPASAPTDPAPHRRTAEPGEGGGRAADPTRGGSGRSAGDSRDDRSRRDPGSGASGGGSGTGESRRGSGSGGSGSSGPGGSGSDTSGSDGSDSGSGGGGSSSGGSDGDGSGGGGSSSGGSDGGGSGGSGSGGSDGGDGSG